MVAHKRLPQFQGYRSKAFPGISQKRLPNIEPRRMVLPPDFEFEWRRIGSKRTHILSVQEFPEDSKFRKNK